MLLFESGSYEESCFDIPERHTFALHEAPISFLEPHVTRIVQIEGPIHIEEVGRRLSRLWGYRRAGGRIQQVVSKVIDAAVRMGHVCYTPKSSQNFVDRPERSKRPKPRDRSNVVSTTLRKVSMLPPSEVRSAILEAVEHNIEPSSEECAVETARMFGSKSTSLDMKNLVKQQIEDMCLDNLLLVSENIVKIIQN